jgi:hypothetical protein
MIQRGERLRFVRETLRKLRIRHALRREQLQRDKAIERSLPRLVDDPHSAASEALENLELRKIRGQFFRRRGRFRPRRARVVLCRSGQPREQTPRTEPLRSLIGQRRAAVRAFLGAGRHWRFNRHTFY